MTQYHFKDWMNDELVEFALEPPFDVEARDWKALAKELANRLERCDESLRKF